MTRRDTRPGRNEDITLGLPFLLQATTSDEGSPEGRRDVLTPPVKARIAGFTVPATGHEAKTSALAHLRKHSGLLKEGPKGGANSACDAGSQKVYFSANCILRVGYAELIMPNRLFVTLAKAGTAAEVGVAVLARLVTKLLVRLKASARS
jgi:hypothetical protein